MFGLFAQARMITERQYQKLMKTFQENGGNVSDAALRAGVSRETAADYLNYGTPNLASTHSGHRDLNSALYRRRRRRSTPIVLTCPLPPQVDRYALTAGRQPEGELAGRLP